MATKRSILIKACRMPKRKLFEESLLMLAYYISKRAARIQPCPQLQGIVDAFEAARRGL